MRWLHCLVHFIAWSGLLAAAGTADSLRNENPLIWVAGRRVLGISSVSQLVSADVELRRRTILNAEASGNLPFPDTLDV